MKSFLALLLSVVSLAAADLPVSVAVFDFQSSEVGPRDAGPKFSSLVLARLSEDVRLVTVERAELDKATAEQELSLSGSVSASTATKVGQLTGAKVLVTGRIIQSGGETLAVAKVFSTETTRVFGVTEKLGQDGSLSEPAAKLAEAISKLIAQHSAELAPKVEAAADRIARMKASVAHEKALPVVSVSISEQHFGRPAVDPAAETEMLRLLEACGFRIADEKSGVRADFAITGEAFSERALQRGNLTSCRARVEIKLRNLATGTLILADRQVSVATDLGEHIAAKSALAAAGMDLIERILPKIR